MSETAKRMSQYFNLISVTPQFAKLGIKFLRQAAGVWKGGSVKFMVWVEVDGIAS